MMDFYPLFFDILWRQNYIPSVREWSSDGLKSLSTHNYDSSSRETFEILEILW